MISRFRATRSRTAELAADNFGDLFALLAVPASFAWRPSELQLRGPFLLRCALAPSTTAPPLAVLVGTLVSQMVSHFRHRLWRLARIGPNPVDKRPARASSGEIGADRRASVFALAR